MLVRGQSISLEAHNVLFCAQQVVGFMLFKLLLPYLPLGWDSYDFCEPASKDVKFQVSVLICAIRGMFLLRLIRLPLLVEDVLAQGLVLGLILERHLVDRHLLCVCQTVGGRH